MHFAFLHFYPTQKPLSSFSSTKYKNVLKNTLLVILMGEEWRKDIFVAFDDDKHCLDIEDLSIQVKHVT